MPNPPLTSCRKKLGPKWTKNRLLVGKNSATPLESDQTRSWRKITNFLKPEGPRSYPSLKFGKKTAK